MALAEKVFSSLYVASCLRCICRFMVVTARSCNSTYLTTEKLWLLSKDENISKDENRHRFQVVCYIIVPVLIKYLIEENFSGEKFRQGKFSLGKSDEISKLSPDKSFLCLKLLHFALSIKMSYAVNY